MYKQDCLDSEPVEFLDPNKLSTDGTVALVRKRFSHDGSLLAYGLSTSGSDWFTIHIKDVTTGQDMPEKLEKAKFSSIEWTKDGKGDFFLSFLRQRQLHLWQVKKSSNPNFFYLFFHWNKALKLMFAIKFFNGKTNKKFWVADFFLLVINAMCL